MQEHDDVVHEPQKDGASESEKAIDPDFPIEGEGGQNTSSEAQAGGPPPYFDRPPDTD